MKHFHTALLACFFGFVPAAAASAAEENTSALGEAWVTVQLRSAVRPGMSIEYTKARFARLFTRSDVNGGGVSQSDYDEKANIMLAKKRSRTISRLLAKDLNGDGVVSADELKSFFLVRTRRPIRANGVQFEPTQQQIEQMLEQLVKKDLAFDGNGDGTITYPEMLSAAQARNAKQIWYMRRNRRNVPLEMDQNSDGTVSREEFDQVVTRVLAKADLNNDGRFSRDELMIVRSQAGEIRRMKRSARKI